MNRRGFLGGLVTALAAPAIIRTPGLLMPVKPFATVADTSFTSFNWDLFTHDVPITADTSTLLSMESERLFREYLILLDPYGFMKAWGHDGSKRP